MISIKQVAFAIFLAAAFGLFAKSSWRLIRLARLGKDKSGLFKDPVDRIGNLFYIVFLQKKVVREPFGFNHVLFFWSFVIIAIGHSEFIVRGVIPQFSLHFLGDFLYSSLLRGQDIMAFLVLFAVVFALIRRWGLKPAHIAWKSKDAHVILGLITLVMVTYFIATAFGLRGGHPDVKGYDSWLPVSAFLSGSGFIQGVSAESAAGIWYEVFWWTHAVVMLGFLNYLPFSKHLHLLGSMPNVYTEEREKLRGSFDRIDFETAETYGVGRITDFTWKALLETYACTECGRCDFYCPANNTGKPLQPQGLIHDMKDNLFHNGDALLKERKITEFAPAPDDFEPTLPLICESEEDKKKGQISPEVLWSCTACGACVAACPVLIQHVDWIQDMRRHLTLMEGNVSPELAMTFKNIENNYNPWGIGADKRADWAEGMGLKIWEESDDAKKFDYLFWVGCAGSYDNRAQKVVRAFTRILAAADISYAILGTKEKCTGDPVRRTGNEYMFEEIAVGNVEALNTLGVKKIVTICPHCYNTLQNEYPAYGGHYEVLHHTQLIAELVSRGRLNLSDSVQKKVVFHDPCYLGRWNKEFDAPRRSIAAVGNLDMVEMAGCKDKSFCCGAGGGQMWMEESIGTRVNEERTKQALETEPDVIAVACPFCMTMLEDGIKANEKEEEIKVLDVAEIIANALEEEKQASETAKTPA